MEYGSQPAYSPGYGDEKQHLLPKPSDLLHHFILNQFSVLFENHTCSPHVNIFQPGEVTAIQQYDVEEPFTQNSGIW